MTERVVKFVVPTADHRHSGTCPILVRCVWRCDGGGLTECDHRRPGATWAVGKYGGDKTRGEEGGAGEEQGNFGDFREVRCVMVTQ